VAQGPPLWRRTSLYRSSASRPVDASTVGLTGTLTPVRTHAHPRSLNDSSHSGQNRSNCGVCLPLKKIATCSGGRRPRRLGGGNRGPEGLRRCGAFTLRGFECRCRWGSVRVL
jgi:hypothetical protein